MKQTVKFITWLAIGMFAVTRGQAQDLHFSQYFNTPLLTNPANTGFIPDGNYRIGVNYRNQWASVPVPYKTMSASADFQLLRDRLEYGWLGVGAVILRDVAGSGNLTSTKVYGSVAYHQLLGQSSLLSLGFNVGTAGKRVDITKLTFGDQWNGKFFDAGVPSAEPIVQSKVNYFDLQAGMNYAYFPTENIYINAGVSVQHINKPRETFYAGNNIIDRRYIGFLNASIKMSDKVIINPSAYYARQAAAQEIVLGMNAAYNLSGDGVQQLHGGIYYRAKDAAIFLVGYQLNNVKLMFNYDITTSTLASSNNRRGAYEIGIVYTGLYPNWSFNNAKKSTICPSF
ncbi:PorP/SprF family type IX secretion system membrane protein [Chitinophaga nivalis]|uniref:PorP/SprF family type IX secretion system membrane protein n=1 Tax=Chitinophaga nivalis TaxID=2991709 RepID=A0ABT3ISK8_9BACT|nr:PorP/SprF family type IX secretion system membrane protein [Chitinophaga nivalis]MCW3463350.1 PorP/SprF family type IX secretion system membrane protein [Chitinophaga nivalis]MCW3486960.1 PorP/SprF family type IX secretion system membrane protein [Chitinophaga nivalis]